MCLCVCVLKRCVYISMDFSSLENICFCFCSCVERMWIFQSTDSLSIHVFARLPRSRSCVSVSRYVCFGVAPLFLPPKNRTIFLAWLYVGGKCSHPESMSECIHQQFLRLVWMVVAVLMPRPHAAVHVLMVLSQACHCWNEATIEWDRHTARAKKLAKKAGSTSSISTKQGKNTSNENNFQSNLYRFNCTPFVPLVYHVI